jgi:hypothetical protein
MTTRPTLFPPRRYSRMAHRLLAVGFATTPTSIKGICVNARYNNVILEEVRSLASRPGENLASTGVQVDSRGVTHLDPGREIGCSIFPWPAMPYECPLPWELSPASTASNSMARLWRLFFPSQTSTPICLPCLLWTSRSSSQFRVRISDTSALPARSRMEIGLWSGLVNPG